MKFLLNKDKEVTFLDKHNILDYRFFAFNMNNKDETIITYSKNDEEAIDLLNLFQLKINVKDVGVFIFYMNKEGFTNKEELFRNIAKLKEVNVIDIASRDQKLNSLLELLKDEPIEFITYNPGTSSFLYSDEELFSLLNDYYVFYLTHVNNVTTRKNKIFFIKNVLLEQYIFAALSALLIGLTSSLTAYNFAAEKGTAIIFLLCAIAGASLNAYVYYDYFKSAKISFKNIVTITTILTSIALLFVGLWLYYLFSSFIKEPIENPPALWLLILIMSLIYVVSTIAAYILSVVKKRKLTK